MSNSIARRMAGALLGAATLASPLAAASGAAQTYPSSSYPTSGYPQSGYPQSGYPQSNYPQSGYPQSGYPTSGNPQGGYPQSGYPQQGGGYDQAYQDYDRAPPQGYDPSRPPPPPPGYQGDAGGSVQQDQRYEAYAEDWSQRYCTRARNNTGAGAVIGGLFGALLGSSVAGRHDRGDGALVGGLAGAAGGAVVGSASSNATSPGCPPGYVVRGGAPAFAYEGYGDPYLYAAPGWYQPWFFIGGRWNYRPYPYHNFYYSRFGYGRGYYGGGRGYGGRGYYGGGRGRR